MIIKGPGVAVRAPPGTKYRVYGLVVVPANNNSDNNNNNTDNNNNNIDNNNNTSGAASRIQKRTVYISNLDSDEEEQPTTGINTNTQLTNMQSNTITFSSSSTAPAAAAAASSSYFFSSSPANIVTSNNNNNNNNNNNVSLGVGIVSSLREHERMLEMILSLPLGTTATEHATLRSYAWRGNVLTHIRSEVWRLLCGYTPCAPASIYKQQTEVRRKREEYDNFVAKYYRITITDFMQPSNSNSNFSDNFNTGQIQHGIGGYHPFREDTTSQLSKSISIKGNNISSSSSSSSSLLNTMTMITPDERAILSQIALDLPRHSQALFHLPETASALARCLFLWSRRYPAVGYVQGIDDIMVIFFFVFLEGAINERNLRYRKNKKNSSITESNSNDDIWINSSVVFTSNIEELRMALTLLPEELFKAAEADTYFCGGFFLSWLQDNFVQGQPGILRSILLMEKILKRSDPILIDSIQSHGISLIDCCLQWVHCFLSRELPLELTVLLWEKYLAIGNSEFVLDFHAYVCSSLVMYLRDELIGKTVDVVIQRLKDPLKKRTKQQQQQQQQQKQTKENINNNLYDQQWLTEIIATASKLSCDYPIDSLE